MIRIITINCNGLREPYKISYLKSMLENDRIDVCFIQETHIDNINLGNLVERKLNFKCFWSFTDNSRNKGVGILINKHFDCHISNFQFDNFGRFVLVDININDFDFRLISIYAPNANVERKLFFEEIYHLFLSTKPIIFGGDFNCVLNLDLDKMGGNPEKGNDGSYQLKNILNDYNLVDCYRKKYPNSREFTWSSQGVSCRLDRIYVSSCLYPNIQITQHHMYTMSDHHSVYLEFSSFNHQKVGKSYWKFNNSLLKDPDYLDYMSIFLENNVTNHPDDSDMLIWWDDLKQNVKCATIQFSINKKKRERYVINHLRSEYCKYEREGNHHEAQNIKDKIKEIEIENLKGSLIRSKSLHLEGEKPSKYFLYRELCNNKKKTIKKIINKDGTAVQESGEILECFRDYFANLFRDEPVDNVIIDDLLTNLPTINEDERKVLGSSITNDEIVESLNSFQNNKSPGSDGLTKEFYLAFINILLPILTKLFDIIFKTGNLSKSQKNSYISVLCKDEKNSEILGNYRPISLLNVDYKILTKALSRRLENVLGKIIHSDQTCAIPGRSIIDNCHTLRDILDYANAKNINGILLSLDQQKAFDRVSHVYLFKVLSAFGLGENFVKWIKTIYKDIFSSVIINHFISVPFSLTRSVRQGCCLSPLLYVLCLEPLFIKIRNDNDVKGFQIPGRAEEQKISAFADDSNFSLQDDKSVQKVIDYFEYFGKASGSKLNKSKSMGLYFGKWKTRSDHPFGISWVKKMKIFGIFFGDISDTEIWNPIYQKIVSSLNLYKSRNLSLYGRSCIVNVMALSKLWYMCSVLCVPEKFIDLIEKEIFSFIWGKDKMELLSRNTCYFPKGNGGISLNNIRIKIASIQLAQISKIVYHDDLTWTSFGHFWLGITLKQFDDYDFSNQIPHCIEDLPSYYEALRDTIHFVKSLDETIIPSKNAHCKFFYTRIIDAFVKVHGTNIEEKYLDINFKDVFSNVSNRCIDPLCLNVTYKLAHRVLPVADRLYTFGIRIDRLCSLCKIENETIEHLFFYCTRVQWAKRFLVSWLHDVCDCGISMKTVIFSVFDKNVHKINLKTVLIILSEYRFCIWSIRNKIRFERKNLGAYDIVSYFVNRMKCRILIDFQRFDLLEFHNLWVHKSICSIVEGKIHYNFELSI